MLVRPGKHNDIAQLVEMGERMHQESAYAFLPFDAEKVAQFITGYLDNTETRCGLVAEESSVIIGMFAGYITDYFFCNERVACDMLLFVERENRGSSAAMRLIKGFRDWARERGARELCMGISTNIKPEATGRFYEKMGMSFSGALYKQRLALGFTTDSISRGSK